MPAPQPTEIAAGPAPQSLSRWSRSVVRRGALAAGAALVLLFATITAFAEVGKLDFGGLRLAPGWLLLSIVGFLGLQLAHAALWRRQLQALGPQLEPRRARAIWCTSALARYVPTSMLMPTLRIAWSNVHGVPKRQCVASLIYEAALAVAGALVVAAYFVIQLPALDGTPSRWLVLILPVVAVAVLHPRLFRPLSDYLLRRAGREPLPRTLSQRQLLGLIALYALSFVLAGASLFCLTQALIPVGADAIPTVLGAFAVGFAASVLAFVMPAGLGAREVALAAVLAPVLAAGPAAAVAVASRLVQLGIEVVMAATTPALANRVPAGSGRSGFGQAAQRGVPSRAREDSNL